ncbi:MAG TPA: hypothetical protein VFB32_02100 [Rudaea sp.]|nr:hypothetical protein [Rudaea sp.]
MSTWTPEALADGSAGPAVPYYRDVQKEPAGVNRQARLLLAAAVIDGKESDRSIALRRATADAEYGVSLETLGAALGIVVTAREDGFVVDTPLGHAEFVRAEITPDRGGNFVPLSLAATKLGCRLRFNEAEFALVVDTSWRDLRAEPLVRTETVPIDVHAPQVSLSRWRSEVTAQTSGGDTTTSTITDLGGALGPGYWQAQILNGIGNRASINELVWVLDQGRARWLIGQQRVAVNPLLPGFDLTGVQMAYTNAPDYLYAQAPLSGQLVPYAANPLTVIRGEGPPGGIAELRLAGQVLMRQTIGLDGKYEFRNVPAAPGDAVRLEVAIYEFRDVDVPTRVERVYSQASNLQLPEGTWVSFAGAGLNGRRLDPTDNSGGSAGFYQFRYGVSSSLTLDAVLQDVAGQGYGSAGAAASLGPFGTWATYGARNSRGSTAYEVLGDGQRGDWFWHLDAQHLDAGFAANEAAIAEIAAAAPATDTDYVEAGRSFGTTARVSVVHGSVTDPVNGNIDYTKLAADLHPLPSLSLNVRPDYRGDYSYTASWFPTQQAHLSVTGYIDRTEGAAEYEINNDYRVMATGLHQQGYGNREGLFLSRTAFGSRHFTWTAGALVAGSSKGYFLEGALELRPGLTARLDALKDPLLNNAGSAGTTWTLDVVADFAVTGSGLARGGYDIALRQVGGISGALLGDLPRAIGRDALAHVGVNVNGQVRTETDESGHFYIDNLKPGVYRVSLDPDNLPIELSGSEHARNVEVRSGATTRADFHLELSLGCAGRVLGYGDTQGLAVAVLDASGKRVAQADVSRFGFFRIDGLKPGSYRLELRNAAGAAIASLTVDIVDRFVFGLKFAAAGTGDAGKTHD